MDRGARRIGFAIGLSGVVRPDLNSQGQKSRLSVGFFASAFGWIDRVVRSGIEAQVPVTHKPGPFGDLGGDSLRQ